jgi:hypothetical protein
MHHLMLGGKQRQGLSAAGIVLQMPPSSRQISSRAESSVSGAPVPVTYEHGTEQWPCDAAPLGVASEQVSPTGHELDETVTISQSASVLHGAQSGPLADPPAPA